MVGAGDGDLLPPAVLRSIGDKLYEKVRPARVCLRQEVPGG